MEQVSWEIVLVIAVAAFALGGLLTWLIMRRRTSAQLKRRFGPEYDQVVSDRGDRTIAEGELREREKRVEMLKIRPLTEDERIKYAQEWRTVQSEFVDKPDRAVSSADRLLERVMEVRGYPMDNFDQRAADVSVDHPRVVENYRQGHALAVRAAQGEASTEDLRQAMVHYKALFEDLVEQQVTNGTGKSKKRVGAKR